MRRYQTLLNRVWNWISAISHDTKTKGAFEAEGYVCKFHYHCDCVSRKSCTIKKKGSANRVAATDGISSCLRDSKLKYLTYSNDKKKTVGKKQTYSDHCKQKSTRVEFFRPK